MFLFIGNNDTVNNPTLFTPWTIVHVASICSLYALLINFIKPKYVVYIIIFLHSLYELKDYYYSYINIKYNRRYSNSWLNSIGDTLGCFLGMYLSHKLKINLILSCIVTLILRYTCVYFNYD